MIQNSVRTPLLGVLFPCLILVATATSGPLVAQEPPSPAGAAIEWWPGEPRQGRLVRLRVTAPEGGTIQEAEGVLAGEALHLEEDDGGGWFGLAGLPVDGGPDVALVLRLRYADGSSEEVESLIPVEATPFRHEELTVAPRYGSPPSEEDRARRAADVAKARTVSETAHRTPRLWGSSVVIPRDDRVTSEFGNGRIFNGQVSSRHLGLDLDGETGDTVYAASRGVVALVDTFQLAGNIVYLNHGAGLVSGYFHLSEQLVATGDTVSAGAPIGRVGATGRVTGPHLHWVVRYGHTSVDPRSLLEVLPATGGPEGR